MNWLEIVFFPMWLILDVPMVVLLLVCAWYTYRIYTEMPATEVLRLLWGWVIIAGVDMGFIAVDLMPDCNVRMWLAEAIVGARAIPIAVLAWGMHGMFQALRRALNGKK